MKSKEKAKELFIKYRNIIIDDVIDMKPAYFIMSDKMAKQCALYAVDEIIESKPYRFVPFLDYTDCTVLESNIKYWQEVKKEIEKI
jgi:hypothetical protein